MKVEGELDDVAGGAGGRCDDGGLALRCERATITALIDRGAERKGSPSQLRRLLFPALGAPTMAS